MLVKVFGRGFDSLLLHMKTLEEELTDSRNYHKRQLTLLETEIEELEDKLIEKREWQKQYAKFVKDYDILLEKQSIPWLLDDATIRLL